MTFLGIPVMVLVVAALLAIVFVGVVGFVWLLDHNNPPRDRIPTVGVDCPALPLAVALPTAHRRKHPSRWP